jgi:uncharacterized protein YihD (DUF1040 family)
MNEIPQTVYESIDYLTNIFVKSINSPVHSKEDLSQDLIVYFLENKDDAKVKKFPVDSKDYKNYWFIHFKNYLIDKYRRVIFEKKLLEKIKKTDILDSDTSDSSRLLDL